MRERKTYSVGSVIFRKHQERKKKKKQRPSELGLIYGFGQFPTGYERMEERTERGGAGGRGAVVCVC